MGYQPRAVVMPPSKAADLCRCLHRTAELEKEIYGKVVSHSVHLHVTRDCPVLKQARALSPPRPPNGAGGGSRRPPSFSPDRDIVTETLR